ncbi:MAG TPA: tetratricopeptide repeat-containing glycosyltransferase family protein [Patescibacteria group bacterium]|nr:tetratricopeptide repeat-containing glycosyltransferase family protein [Patescibacteria group bacterium]
MITNPAQTDNKHTPRGNCWPDLPPQRQIERLRQQTHQLMAQKRLSEAESHCLHLLALDPFNAEAHEILGHIYYTSQNLEAAVQRWETSFFLRPEHKKAPALLLEAWHKLGEACHARDQYDTAVGWFTRVVTLNSNNAAAFGNLGVSLKNTGRLEPALAAFQRALEMTPQDPLIHWNYSRALLLAGDLSTGFRHYEWRTHFKHLGVYEDWMLTGPRWQGEPFPGKRLLIYNDQGLGDILQMLRYLPLVKERGGTVIFAAGQKLLRLLSGFPGIDELIPHTRQHSVAANADLTTLEMSLPHLFSTTLDTIPGNVPYLRPNPQLVRQWHARLPATTNRKIGLVWSGNTRKSFSLADYAPLSEVSGITCFSLQIGEAAEQAQSPPPGLPLIDLTCHIRDLADTAALIANLDLVITIDTSVAHLAAALGKPTWILVTKAPCWRWLLERNDSPWYPTVRLFRQDQADDWSKPVCRIAASL